MEQIPAQRRFTYAIDASNRIVEVNGEWLDFARENQAPELCGERVLGKSLLDFISGREVRHLYQLIIDRVRARNTAMVVPFRCDSSTLRRFMELEISPTANRGVLFTARLLDIQQRRPVALFDNGSHRSQDRLQVCSWCKRVDVAGNWVDVEQATQQLHLFDQAALPQISHGICLECSHQVSELLDQPV